MLYYHLIKNIHLNNIFSFLKMFNYLAELVSLYVFQQKPHKTPFIREFQM